MNEKLASLPVTHILLKGSLIWPQSKQKHKEHMFPPGILQTKELPVALIPDELAEYQQPGQVLFISHQPFAVDYFPNHFIHKYGTPWILFGFLNHELTIPASKNDQYQQFSLL
jgi:hypothetical protein